MSGTRTGGLKTAAKNLAKNPNFYSDIGKIGGRNGHTGGFAANPELAREAGRKGGRISRRNGPPVYENVEVVTKETVRQKRRFAIFGM